MAINLGPIWKVTKQSVKAPGPLVLVCEHVLGVSGNRYSLQN